MAERVATTFSRWLPAAPEAAALLGVDRVVHADALPRARRDALVVAAGDAPERARAVRYARARGLPCAHVAPAPFGLERARRGLLVGLVIDALGEPLSRDSSLEARLTRPFDDALRTRAEALIARLRAGDVSVYNDAPTRALGPIVRGSERVLVVAVAEELPALVARALAERPDAEVVALEAHGDDVTLASHARLRVLTGRAHPASVLADVARVYVTDSLVGFEALVRGIPVTCMGTPFYAGRGLTADHAAIDGRVACDLVRLFAEVCLEGAVYLDPELGRVAPFEQVLAFLARQREKAMSEGGPLRCVGFSPWKQTFIPAFLGAPSNEVRFGLGMRGSATDVLVVWGNRHADHVKALGPDARVLRMEDGFLRSVGLGSDSHVPASLVVDSRGIYFDPRTPSDLEHMLATAEFTEDELARAAALRQRIVVHEVSKYNVAARATLALPDAARGKDVALVVGQVDDDASVKLGTRDIGSNRALLRAVREARPAAYVVYKPHPDVTSGNRAGAIPATELRAHADLVVTDVGIAACLRAATEVHTMTSLVGFEALLRGLPVHVYGQPFYAGWGLTTDRHPHERRFRNRSLDELVAATLLRYPRYVHPRTGRFTTPEAIVDHLVSAKRSAREGALEHAFLVRYGRMALAILRSYARGG